jgi:membrane associated rhomboid family serine protease
MRPVGFAVPLGHGMACLIDNQPINWYTPVISMFLHGGWGHILGNALFFWVFGNNIEDSMGPVRFLVFYILCGLVAAAAHVLTQPSSPIPTVGASGAISGVLGAYLVLYPRARVNILFWLLIFIRVIPVPAWAALLWWFGWQIVAALPQLSPMRPEISGGVAVWAHIGGFIAGMILVKLFENPAMVAKRKLIRESQYSQLLSQ